MKVKKFFVSLVVLVMVMSFAACGSSSEDSSSDNINASEDENSVEESEPDDNSNDSSTSDGSVPLKSNEATFEEVTIVDDENMTITVESFDADDSWGPTFNLFLENKTEDVTLMFSIQDCSVMLLTS